MRFIAVIPSRLESTRLPSKPLIDIAGKSLIQRVYEGIKGSKKLSEIYIATDSSKILEHSKNFDAKCIMTPSEMPSGTDRIWYAIKEENIKADVIINIQGDEPFVNSKLIDDFCIFLEYHPVFQVGTIIKKISNLEELTSQSVVKVVINKNKDAIYFSRNSIPFVRDYPFEKWLDIATFYKHIGIYAYKYEILERFTSLPQSNLEKLEKLEQLRLLEDGIKYLCYETNKNLLSIDTISDLEEARNRFSKITD